MFYEVSKSKRIFTFIGIILALIVLVAIEGWIVACLWNWLMPTIFGLTTITTGQGVGLCVLCGILFKPIGYNSSKKS